MVFNDTTNKNGILQECEFWTGLGDGTITGDTTLKAQFTSRVNQAFDRLSPLLYSWSDYLKWDDTNNTDLPSATFNIVSGQADYVFSEDDNSLDILNIVAVRILPSGDATAYTDLRMIDMGDPRAVDAIAPNSNETGVPDVVLKRGNTLHFNPIPNYDATAGGKILFERETSYFAASDTVKERGIPKPFHGLLPLYASHDWLVVNKPANQMLITRLETQIQKREAALDRAMRARHPSQRIMRPAITPYI
jgi:hypothetical protein